MKILALLICLTFLSISAEAQWTNQNIVPAGNNLWSTFFVDDSTGWIVGSGGFIIKTTNSGTDWTSQNSGTTVTLKSLQFINQNTGWICGENGVIITTIDGGNTWNEVNSNTTETLNDLHFTTPATGYIIGNNELILNTTDGGVSWITQNYGNAYDLHSVDFIDSLIGFAVGGRDSSKFLKTTNGGLDWIAKEIYLSYTSTPILNCVEFIDENNGYIGSEGQYLNHSGYINRTTDGGESWFSQLLLRPVENEDPTLHAVEDNPTTIQQRGIRSIYFKDSMNGYAVGGSVDGWWRSIYATTDGGNTWQKKYGYSEQTGLLSVAVTNNGNGIAVGYKGVIYKTSNNGSSWSQLLSGTQQGYTGDWIGSVFMINENLGWASGFRKGIWYYPLIMKTTNGGRIWETNKEFANTFSRDASNIFFIDENIGWATFYNKSSYKTTDGGVTWIQTGNPGNAKYFKNQDTGWSVYSPLGVYKSTDGGNQWTQKSNVSSNSIYFTDINNGWAVGQLGSIIKSTDGGENWEEKNSGIIDDINSVHFYDAQYGACVGNNGNVLLTSDGGENWNSLAIGNVSTLNSVVYASANTLWITGTNGTILNSTDQGISWISYTDVTNNNLSSASFVDENTGWFAGSNATILKYQNEIVPVELLFFTANMIESSARLNWQTATEVNNYGFEIERKLVNAEWEKIGFVEGRGNSTTTMNYSFIDNSFINKTNFKYRLKQIDFNGNYEYSNEVNIENIPTEFALFQNYPNPFNPSTKIRYQLPHESKVTIKIYDALGSEIATLVNENKEVGTYEVEYNAQSLSSGTYIYRIIADDFVETRKMSLLK